MPIGLQELPYGELHEQIKEVEDLITVECIDFSAPRFCPCLDLLFLSGSLLGIGNGEKPSNPLSVNPLTTPISGSPIPLTPGLIPADVEGKPVNILGGDTPALGNLKP